MTTYEVTLTDTMCGQPNYSWVNRQEIKVSDGLSAKSIGTKARAAVGMTGVRSSMFVDYGDMIQIDFSAQCVVLFITPKTTTN